MSLANQLLITEINSACDTESVAEFLSNNHWPFHARSQLTLAEARQIKLGPPTEVRTFWLTQQDARAGLLRIFDLQDATDGSVQFDLRVAEAFRNQGLGQSAVAWLVEMLFREYPQLHRIEAATRIDNHPMRRILELNHFHLEGQLRQTWRSDSGVRHDTTLHGRLRSDD